VTKKALPLVVEAEPSDLRLMMKAGVNNVRLPWRLASVLARSRPELNWLPRRKEPEEERFNPPKVPVPRTRFNKPVSAHRVFTGRMLEFSEFKPIRKTVEGATVNDLILAICAGGLRRYLQDKGELPEESLVAAVPINTRTEADRDVAGNVVSMMSVALQTQLDDPLERLRVIRDATQAEKTTEKAVSARQMTDINQHLPAATLSMASRLITATGLVHRTKPVFNCVITNVPGPQIPLYQCGAELLATWGCGPVLDGMGLILSAHSYNGKLFLCATSCRDTLPDPDFFADCLQDSFDELRKAARVRGKPAKKRSREER